MSVNYDALSFSHQDEVWRIDSAILQALERTHSLKRQLHRGYHPVNSLLGA
jgi:hypothetical protein